MVAWDRVMAVKMGTVGYARNRGSDRVMRREEAPGRQDGPGWGRGRGEDRNWHPSGIREGGSEQGPARTACTGVLRLPRGACPWLRACRVFPSNGYRRPKSSEPSGRGDVIVTLATAGGNTPPPG